VKKKSITDYPNAPDIESSTRDYATRFDGPVGEWMLRQQTDATRKCIARRLPDRSSLSVLDVGGGHGQNIALINELGHHLTIVGSTPDSNEVIKSSVESGEVKYEVASLLSLPYEDDSFDVVICYRILSHMELWQDLIGELTRVARHLVLVDYPSKRSFNIFSDMFFILKKRIEKNTRRYGCFSDSEIDAIFLRCGFSRKERRRQFFLPMAGHRLIGNLTVSKFIAAIFRKSGLTALFGSPVISAFQSD
jgi:ubiquinone/menaquinone biosynthesis C-methylase UbiE